MPVSRYLLVLALVFGALGLPELCAAGCGHANDTVEAGCHNDGPTLDRGCCRLLEAERPIATGTRDEAPSPTADFQHSALTLDPTLDRGVLLLDAAPLRPKDSQSLLCIWRS